MKNDFDWTDDIEAMDIPSASKSNIKFNPELSDTIFHEVKKKCILIWNTHDNTFGFVDEKVNQIIGLTKSWDNVLRMVRMFHPLLQKHLFKHLSSMTNESIKLELLDRKYKIDYL